MLEVNFIWFHLAFLEAYSAGPKTVLFEGGQNHGWSVGHRVWVPGLLPAMLLSVAFSKVFALGCDAQEYLLKCLSLRGLQLLV